MRKKLYVVAALIEREGRVLLDRRKKGSHLEDTWEFPGGKREDGETDAQALLREILEELGVEGRVTGEEVARIDHAYEEFDLTLVLYPMEVFGEPQALDVAEVRWFELGELERIPMPPADRPLVEAILGR